MMYSSHSLPRRSLGIMLLASAIAIAGCSSNDTSTLPTKATFLAKPDANIAWNFTPVVFGSGDSDSLVTSMNDESRIVGVSGKAGSTYNSYSGKCTLTTGTNVFFVCSKIVERDYPTALSTYIAGQNQGKFEVGWAVPSSAVPSCNPCGFVRILNNPNGDEARRNSGSGGMSCFNPQQDNESSWCMFKEPNEGTGNCAVTEILGVNSYRDPVGFYETNNGNGATCTQQAFGMNWTSGSKLYTYHKFIIPGAASSTATGIDDQGAVIGTMTTSGSKPITKAWTYVGSGYQTFQCGGSSANDNTYALGVVGIKSNLVVGYYVDSAAPYKTHGFYVREPQSPFPNCETIDYSTKTTTSVVLTAVTSIDDSDDISGYFQAEGSQPLEGFVAYCKANC